MPGLPLCGDNGQCKDTTLPAKYLATINKASLPTILGTNIWSSQQEEHGGKLGNTALGSFIKGVDSLYPIGQIKQHDSHPNHMGDKQHNVKLVP